VTLLARSGLAPFAAVSASYFAYVGFFNPYLPLWLSQLGQPLWAIGVLISVQSFTRVFMPYVWGWLGDQTGRPVWCMRVGAWSAWVAAIGLWAYSSWVQPGFWGLMIGLLLVFLPTSAIIPTSETLMTRRLREQAEARGQTEGFDAKGYGRLRMWGSLGFLLTVLLAGGLFERVGIGAFMVVSVVGLSAVVAAVLWLPGDSRSQRERQQEVAGQGVPIGSFLRQRAHQWFFLSVFLHVLAHIGLYLYLSLWLEQNGYSKTWIGALWALGVAAEIAMLYGQGRFLGRLSWATWLAVCGAVTALRMLVLGAGVGSLAWLLFAQLLHGLTFATHHTAVMGVISERAQNQLSGRVQALYAVIGYGASGLVGGAVGSVLSQQLGLGAVFYASAGFAVLAAASAWRFGRALTLVVRSG
jgi:MFS transporter, PPP family, 3-phenylpropionic acid transporter